MKTLIVLVGPTCTGKSTVEKELNKRGYPSVTSFTTRAPRTGEVEGKDYYFVTHQQVHKWREEGVLIEEVCYADNYYGNTRDHVDAGFATSDIAVVVVEPHGLLAYQAFASKTGEFNVMPIYINNSLSILTRRLIARFESDVNADPSYYWKRLVELRNNHRDWPEYNINWTIEFDYMDDDSPNTVSLVTDMICNKVNELY
jgi:guanylate kinase